MLIKQTDKIAVVLHLNHEAKPVYLEMVSVEHSMRWRHMNRNKVWKELMKNADFYIEILGTFAKSNDAVAFYNKAMHLYEPAIYNQHVYRGVKI